MLVSPIRALFFTAVLALTLTQQAHFAHADVLIQLVMYSNQNDTLLAAADQETSTLMDTLLGAETSDYQALEPGEAVPGGNRRGLRSPFAGFDRNLQVSCPPRCAHSTTNYCKALGCAKCGASCGGRLRQLLEEGEAAAVVADMNDVLLQYCGGDPGCDIGAMILSVNPDGTATELV